MEILLPPPSPDTAPPSVMSGNPYYSLGFKRKCIFIKNMKSEYNVHRSDVCIQLNIQNYKTNIQTKAQRVSELSQTLSPQCL